MAMSRLVPLLEFNQYQPKTSVKAFRLQMNNTMFNPFYSRSLGF
jgi:hypothetical protein